MRCLDASTFALKRCCSLHSFSASSSETCRLLPCNPAPAENRSPGILRHSCILLYVASAGSRAAMCILRGQGVAYLLWSWMLCCISAHSGLNSQPPSSGQLHQSLPAPLHLQHRLQWLQARPPASTALLTELRITQQHSASSLTGNL